MIVISCIPETILKFELKLLLKKLATNSKSTSTPFKVVANSSENQ